MSRVQFWTRIALVAGIAVAFIFFFGQPMGSDPTTGAVAEVNGEKIPSYVYEFFREQNQETLRSFGDQGIDSDQMNAILDQQTRSSLVRRYLMAQEAESLGLGVSDVTLREDFQANPGFQTEGKFDREIAERYIARTGLGSREYAGQHRRDLLIRNFTRFIASPVRVSDAAARDEIVRNGTKVTLRYATASKAALRDSVSVTPEEAKALVEKEPDRVRGAYQLRLPEFSKEESIRARHILFAGENAEAAALAARGRMEAGENFADLAKELSDDAATRGEGGDLGSFPRGRMMAAFDEVAFALEPGKVSGPVKTDRGVHLILVEAHDPAVQTPFEEVSERLATELLREERATEAARAAANALLEKLAAGEPFVATAEALKLPVSVTAPFGLRDAAVPGLAGVPDLKETAFALTPERPSANRVFADAENLYVISLQTRDEPNQAQIDSELEATRERMVQRERGLTNGLWFSERFKQLDADGAIEQFELASQR